MASDYSAVTQGQLKAIVVAAKAELDARLSGSGGAGSALSNLVASWGAPGAQNHAAVNIGQIKALARIVYDRLIAAGYYDEVPWAFTPGKGNDYLMANLGQVKELFKFDLSVPVPPLENRLNALTRTVVSGTDFTTLVGTQVSPTQTGSGLSNNAFESITTSQNFCERLCGYLTISQADDYQFFLTATGTAELYLSNDHDPANLLLRAKVTSPVALNAWGSAKKSHLLHLEPGRYYVELRHKVGAVAGNKHVQVGWAKYSDTSAGRIAVIPASVLSRRTSNLPLFPSAGPNPWSETSAPAAELASDRNAATRFLIQATFGPSGWNDDAEYGDNGGTTASLHGTECTECNADYRGPCMRGPDDLDGPNGPMKPGDCPYRRFENGVLVHPLFHDSHCGGLCTVPNCPVRYKFPNFTEYHPLVHNRIHGPACGGWRKRGTNTNPPTLPTISSPVALPFDVQEVQRLGFGLWITEQMDEVKYPRSKLHPYVQARHNAGPLGNNYHHEVFYAAWWRNAVTARDQLRQRVAFALSETMVVSVLSLGTADAASHYYDEALSANAFGNFRKLLEDVTLHPAMGLYLNMIKNQKPNLATSVAPNENYARELMQLFSIGMERMHPNGTLALNADGRTIPTYTQPDIGGRPAGPGQPAFGGLAHVFTGWDFDYSSPYDGWFANDPTGWPWYRTTVKDVVEMIRPMKLYPSRHDTARKEVLNRVVLPAYPSANHPTTVANDLGKDELKIVLDEIFNHPNCGPFICRQLIQRLVTSHPSEAYLHRVVSVFNDDGRAPEIDPVTGQDRRQGGRGNLDSVVRAILMDEEARSAAKMNLPTFGKQREPLLRLAAMARAFPSDEFIYSGLIDDNGDGGNPDITPTPRVTKTNLKWMSSWTTGITSFTQYPWQINLGQSPLSAPSVFNFFRPDYKYPGDLGAAGMTTPEFQLTNDTNVMDQANAVYGALFNWTDYALFHTTGELAPGLVSFFTGYRYICMDLRPWITYAQTPGVTHDDVIAQLNKRLLGGQLPPAAVSLCYPPTATPMTTQDRICYMINMIVNSPDFIIQR